MRQESQPLRWGHINLNVRSLEASIEFYKKLGFEVFVPGIPYLGLTMDEEAGELDESSAAALGLATPTRGRACILGLGNGFPKLDLTEWVPQPSDVQTASSNASLGLVRICLASQHLDNDYEHLRKEQVEFLSSPKIAKDGLARIAVCVDPDGTLIELIELNLAKWSELNFLGNSAES